MVTTCLASRRNEGPLALRAATLAGVRGHGGLRAKDVVVRHVQHGRQSEKAIRLRRWRMRDGSQLMSGRDLAVGEMLEHSEAAEAEAIAFRSDSVAQD